MPVVIIDVCQLFVGIVRARLQLRGGCLRVRHRRRCRARLVTDLSFRGGLFAVRNEYVMIGIDDVDDLGQGALHGGRDVVRGGKHRPSMAGMHQAVPPAAPKVHLQTHLLMRLATSQVDGWLPFLPAELLPGGPAEDAREGAQPPVSMASLAVFSAWHSAHAALITSVCAAACRVRRTT